MEKESSFSTNQTSSLNIEGAKFEVPLNWTERFLQFIVNHSDHIESVYGSVPGKPTGRPIPHAADAAEKIDPTQENLATIIEQLHAKGIDFNLIMNMSCTGNIFFTDKGKQLLEREVKTARDMGIRQLTVANFDLARRISAIDPEMRILLSVIFNIKDPDQLSYIQAQDFNCNGLIVGKGLNRNMPKLREFLGLARGLKAIVMANDFCPSPNCPERISDHNNACAHANLPLAEELGPQAYISPSIHCRKILMEDTSRFLRAPTINPNNLPAYEAAGVRSFKLSDRLMPDDVLIQACTAYFQREFRGNYFDLFSYTTHFSPDDPMRGRKLGRAEIARIIQNGYSGFVANRSAFVLRPHTDACALAKSGFMNIFKEGGCTNTCFQETHCPSGCKHCQSYADEFVHFDQEDAGAVRENIRTFIEMSRMQSVELQHVLAQEMPLPAKEDTGAEQGNPESCDS